MHKNDYIWSWINIISALAEALRNRNNSITTFNFPQETYIPGKMLITSSTGEFLSKNLRNSISCGTPDKSEIFTILSLFSVQPVGQSVSQKFKSVASDAAIAFDELYII